MDHPAGYHWIGGGGVRSRGSPQFAAVWTVAEAAIPRTLEGLGPGARQLGGRRRPNECARLGQEVLHQVPQGPKALDVVRARPLGGGYCHDRTPGTLLSPFLIALCLSFSRAQPRSRARFPLLFP